MQKAAGMMDEIQGIWYVSVSVRRKASFRPPMPPQETMLTSRSRPLPV